MMTIKVGIIGLGTIGRRVADAVRRQPDMELIGVGVRRATPFVVAARRKGISIYNTGEPGKTGREVDGPDLERLLEFCDVIADTRQAGLGAPWIDRYVKAGVKAVFQGGEPRSAVQLTYNSFINFEAAREKQIVRMTSCNTTGLARLLTTLHREFGLVRADAVLIRCSTDPDKASGGLVNGAAPTFGESHHGEDLRDIAGSLAVYTQAVAVPMSFSHVQSLTLHFKCSLTNAEIVEVLERTPRMVVGDRALGATTGELAMHYAYRDERSRSRGDRPELLVWKDSIVCRGDTVKLLTSVDMQSITIPDTIDCLRALFATGMERSDCVRLTDETLGIVSPTAQYNQIGIEQRVSEQMYEHLSQVG